MLPSFGRKKGHLRLCPHEGPLLPGTQFAGNRKGSGVVVVLVVFLLVTLEETTRFAKVISVGHGIDAVTFLMHGHVAGFAKQNLIIDRDLPSLQMSQTASMSCSSCACHAMSASRFRSTTEPYSFNDRDSSRPIVRYSGLSNFSSSAMTCSSKCRSWGSRCLLHAVAVFLLST